MDVENVDQNNIPNQGLFPLKNKASRKTCKLPVDKGIIRNKKPEAKMSRTSKKIDLIKFTENAF